MKYSVEVMRVREQTIQLNGWAVESNPDSVITYRVEDEAGQPVKAKIVPTRRDDVSQIYYKKIIDRDLGFDIRFPYEHGKNYYLVICGEKKTTRVKYSDMTIRRKTGAANRKVQKLMNLMNMETVHVAWDFLKENGLKALILKSKHKIQGIDDDYDYAEWWNLTKPSEEELEEQKKKKFDYMPKFSIVIPVYKTPEKFLKEMLDSIVEQTYANWELCIADGSPAGESVENVLKKYAEKDARIRYQVLGENRGISGNTNAALEMAEGDFIVLADHDDRLTPNALFECAKKLNENENCDVLYSDEDKLDMDGDELFDPHFKPDFNPDLLSELFERVELLDRAHFERELDEGGVDRLHDRVVANGDRVVFIRADHLEERVGLDLAAGVFVHEALARLAVDHETEVHTGVIREVHGNAEALFMRVAVGEELEPAELNRSGADAEGLEKNARGGTGVVRGIRRRNNARVLNLTEPDVA